MNSGLSWQDLWRIRSSILCSSLLTVAALVLALAAHLWAEDEREAWSQAQQRLRSVRQRSAALQGEQAEYLAQLQRYRQMAPAGGQQPRLQWLERLRRSAAQHHITRLDYEFSAANSAETGTSGNPLLRASRMSLRMDLLHEEDLLGLLADLRRHGEGLVHVRSCSIERLSDSDGITAMLYSQCSMDWLHLSENS